MNGVILLDTWEGLRMRHEYYIPLKKGFILQCEGPHFENLILFRHAKFHGVQHDLCTSNLPPMLGTTCA